MFLIFWCSYWHRLLSWASTSFLGAGVVPLLERWLGNLLARQFEGRVSDPAARFFTGLARVLGVVVGRVLGWWLGRGWIRL